jgi:hypothetical protein
VEFATPLSHNEERIDACYDGEPLRYRTMEDISMTSQCRD